MSGREDFIEAALAERGQCIRADGTTKYGVWFSDRVHDGSYAKGDFCAMGLLWSADHTGRLGVLGGTNKDWAWVPSWWQHWKAIGRATKTPARGRIVFFDFNRSGDPEHVGACLRDNGDGTIETIEFNTLNGQCAIRTRNKADVLGYGDPAWPVAPAPAPVVADDDCWVA
jgi:hypothetical protein